MIENILTVCMAAAGVLSAAIAVSVLIAMAVLYFD